jgi:hypothetical protein
MLTLYITEGTTLLSFYSSFYTLFPSVAFQHFQMDGPVPVETSRVLRFVFKPTPLLRSITLHMHTANVLARCTTDGLERCESVA